MYRIAHKGCARSRAGSFSKIKATGGFKKLLYIPLHHLNHKLVPLQFMLRLDRNHYRIV